MNNSLEYRELQNYCKGIEHYPVLSHDMIFDLARRYQAGDGAAGEQIIHANLRFVVKLSRRYFYSGHNPLEIIQEGNVGLIKALRRYDPERGVPFIYYAAWWIRATIQDFLDKSGKIKTGSPGHAKGLVSLDEKIGPDDHDPSSWVDYLTNGIDPEMICSDKERIHDVATVIQESMATLSKREMVIIHHRCFCDPPRTLGEIGLKIGVSKERVRQIETRTREKLREAIEGRAASCIDAMTSFQPVYMGNSHSLMVLCEEHHN